MTVLYEKRERSLRKAALKGSAEDIVRYGRFMMYSGGERADETRYEELVGLYREAVRQGNTEAMIRLGMLYDTGSLSKQSDVLAMKLYSMAYRRSKDLHEKEIAGALMAARYMESSREEDHEKASDLLHDISRVDVQFAPTAYLFGDAFREGGIWRKHDHKAYESYLVAEQIVYDNEESRRFLGQVLMRCGEVYAYGLYVPKDPDTACRYYAEAEEILRLQADHKDGFAGRVLKRLRRDLAVPEIRETYCRRTGHSFGL